MNRSLALLVLLAAACFTPRSSVAQQQPVVCNTSTGAVCITASNPGNGFQGDPAWLGFGKVNSNLSQIYGMLGNTGTLPLPLYGVQYNNNGQLSSLVPGGTGTWCLNWTSLSSPPTLLPCAGGGTVTDIGMTVPSWLSVSPSSISSSGTFAISGSIVTNNSVLAGAPSGTATALAPRALVSLDIPSSIASNTSGNAATATVSSALATTGSNGTFWGVLGGVQGYYAPPSGLPSCANNQLVYYTSSGTTGVCLTLGTNLSITTGTLNATAGGGGVSAFSGDGVLLSNSSSTGAVTATLANTGAAYGVWGNTGASSGAPSYHSLSSYPTAAFPTLNQDTTGHAATATSATTATNVAGGLANEIPVQTAAGATSFIAAPTTPSTFLEWNGSGFTYAVASGSPGGTNFGVQFNNTGVFGGVLPGTTGAYCLNWASLTAAPTLTTSCPSSGGSTAFQANGVALSSATTVNYENSAAINGLTLTFTNPSAGNVQLGFTGTLTNAGLTNSAVTVNGQTCTLGSTCTVPFQTNSANNTSQAGINLETSTANADGLTVTPTNSATNVEKFEVTGTYTGAYAASGLTGLGTGVGTALGTAVGSAGAFVVNGGAGGTPSSLTLNNATGLPVGSITGLGTGVGTFLATPSSANLRGALTDETGTSAAVFAGSPSLTTPAITGSSTGLTTIGSANASATNYTATLPANTGTIPEINLAQTWSAAQTFNNSDILILGSSTGATTITSANAGASSFTATLPAATDTIAEIAATQTLTNKSIAAGEVNSGTLAAAQMPALTGDVTTSSGAVATTIAAGAVTLAKQANFAASSLQGNPTGSPAAPSAITLGAGLSFSGTTLVAGTAVSVTPGTTTVVGTTAPCLLDNSASTTLGCAALAPTLALTSGTLGTSAPSRTVTTSPTVASTDMGGVIYSNVTGGGTVTIPAISSTVFASNMTLTLVNYSASTAAISTTPTVNAGGGCVSGTGIPAGDAWEIVSNGTTLDCNQTLSAASAGSGTVASSTTGQLPVYTAATTVTGSANATLTTGALTLGVSGTAGSVKMGNATSGTVTIQPVTGTLGTVTASLPANTGTIGELNLAETWSALQTFGTNISIGGVTATGATGTGAMVYGTSPTLSTPALGTPSAINLTNAAAASLPVATIATITSNTFLANATGSLASPTATSAANAVGALNSVPCNPQTVTAYTLVLGDANACVSMSNAASNTLTIPTNASVALPVNTTITVEQLGAGISTVSPASGVTFQSVQYGSSGTQTYALAGIYDFIQFKQTAANTWLVTAVGPGQANRPSVVPTIASGFGSGPSVTHSALTGSTWSFSINVGTGGSATSGVITMPTAPDAWACSSADGGATPTGRTDPTALGASSVTVTNYSRTVGTALAWTASEIIQMQCTAN